VLHAGVLPGWSDLPPAAPDEAFARDARRADELLRARHVTGGPRLRVTVVRGGAVRARPGLIPVDAPLPAAPPQGRIEVERVEAGAFLGLGEQRDDDPYWAEVYDGRFGHIYFGHNPFLDRDRPARFPHATALDLGCVYGGALAAVVLEGGREVGEHIVRAERAHSEW
jgi:hypothetical protein